MRHFLPVVLIASTALAQAPEEADLVDAPRVLIVVTNHAQLGDTGQPTGFFLSEAAHPWHVFTDAGFAVDFASPRGGAAPVDPKSLDQPDEISASFLEQFAPAPTHVIAETLPAADVDAAEYDAVFFAGGHGTMWDFPADENLARLTRAVYESGGVVGAVCHGPAVLVDVRLSDGTYLVAGKTVAAFTDEEEAAVKLTEVVPFLLESKLRERGARIAESPNFEPHVATSDRLVTGQNPASAAGVAEAMVELLSPQGPE